MAIDPNAPAHVACRMPKPIRLGVLDRASDPHARHRAAKREGGIIRPEYRDGQSTRPDGSPDPYSGQGVCGGRLPERKG